MPATLLCIDDSQTIQKAVAITFACEGFQVVHAMTAEEGVEKARALRPNVVLLDTGLPGRSGYDVCQFLRSDPTTQAVPVLLMGGISEPIDEARARQVGAAGHFVKPFDTAGLIERVRTVTGIAAAAAVRPAAVPPASAMPRPPTLAAAPSTAPAAAVLPSWGAAPVAPAVQPRPAPTASLAAPIAPPATAARPVAPPWPPAQPSAAAWAAAASARPATPAAPAAPVAHQWQAPAAARPVAPVAPPPPPAQPAPAWQPAARPPTPVVVPPAAPLAPPAPVAAPPTARTGFDPFGLSLDDSSAGVEVDLGADGSEPIDLISELTLEPPPRPAAPTAVEVAPARPALPPVVPQAAPAPIAAVVAQAPAAAVDRGQISAAVRELVEQIVWEVVPELAETIIREELNRLLAARAAK